MLSTTVFLLAVLATTINAQPNPPTFGSACMNGCISPALVLNGCTGFPDLNCTCPSLQFRADLATCLEQHCSAADLQAAFHLLNADCADAGIQENNATTVVSRSVSFSIQTAASQTTSSPSTMYTTTSGPTSVSTNNVKTATIVAAIVGARFVVLPSIVAIGLVVVISFKRQRRGGKQMIPDFDGR